MWRTLVSLEEENDERREWGMASGTLAGGRSQCTPELRSMALAEPLPEFACTSDHRRNLRFIKTKRRLAFG